MQGIRRCRTPLGHPTPIDLGERIFGFKGTFPRPKVRRAVAPPRAFDSARRRLKHARAALHRRAPARSLIQAFWRRWHSLIPQGVSLMSANFRPLHDRVIVRRVEQDQKTAGGIIIPDTAKEKPSEGDVLAVGPGARDERGQLVPLTVKPGDRILFGKWSGTEVKLDGEELLIMKETDILGIVETRQPAKKAA
jgi:chaperonin GroES